MGTGLRSMWRGTINFSLVSVPVRLFKAADDGLRVSYRNLCPNDDTPLLYKKWCPTEQAEVLGEPRKGFAVGPDRYVVISDADLALLPVKSARVIEVAEFVPAGEIDPISVKATYFVEPDAKGGGGKPYDLFRAALTASKQVAIGKIAFRDRETLCRIAAGPTGLTLTTLYWPEELRDARTLGINPEPLVDKRELAVANQLVRQLSTHYDPSRHADEYRKAVERLVEAKLMGTAPVVVVPQTVTPPKDLMTALKESLAKTTPKKRPVVRKAAAKKAPAKRPRRTAA